MKYKINENLEVVPFRNNYKPLSIVLLIGLLVSIAFYFTREETVRVVHRLVYPKVQNDNDIELSETEIVKCLHQHGCVLPNVAVAQAKLESNLGKSNVGKNAKNMFGITHHKCKYVSGKYGVYAKYETYEDNIKCYIHIQDHYLKAIEGRYASDPGYIQKLKSFSSR